MTDDSRSTYTSARIREVVEQEWQTRLAYEQTFWGAYLIAIEAPKTGHYVALAIAKRKAAEAAEAKMRAFGELRIMNLILAGTVADPAESDPEVS